MQCEVTQSYNYHIWYFTKIQNLPNEKHVFLYILSEPKSLTDGIFLTEDTPKAWRYTGCLKKQVKYVLIGKVLSPISNTYALYLI